MIWYWNWTWYHFGIKSRFSINFSIEIKLKSILCLVSKFWYHALLLPIWCWNYVLGANFALFITPFLVSKSSLTSSFHQFVCQFATSILNLSSLSLRFSYFCASSSLSWISSISTFLPLPLGIWVVLIFAWFVFFTHFLLPFILDSNISPTNKG